MINKYIITNYTRKQAKKHGVSVVISKTRGKKLDVFKNGKKIASIGSSSYGDFPTFTRKYGKSFANKRKKLYKIRHNKDRKKIGSAGYYADRLLW